MKKQTKKKQTKKKQEERKQRDSLKLLLLLVMITGIILIATTYAWFSIQNNVIISEIQGTVKSVDGLMLSLDAKNWAKELNLGDVEKHLDTNMTLKQPYIADESGAYPAGANVIPDQLKPISTTGVDDKGKTTEMTFYTGEYDGQTTLTGIKKATEGYYAFDLYVQNPTEKQVLQLDKGSGLAITGEETTGLQNTSRVGLAMYTLGAEQATLGIEATQKEILTAYNGVNIQDIAIWEPNANSHVTEVIEKNNQLTLGADEASLLNASGKFGAETLLPTYALTTQSATAGTIANIYNWNITDTDSNKIDDNTGLMKQATVQTEDNGLKEVKITSAKNLQNIDGTAFEIPEKTVVKVRVYLWLEGQDVDTINHASQGGTIIIDLGLTK